jgi:rhodanese-related sulfurtransferase
MGDHYLTREPILVIDVREADQFNRLHISTAKNIDSKEFLKLKGFDTEGFKEIVVHCQLSLIRGPTSVNHLDSLLKKQKSNVTLYLLDGGFKGWSRLYGADLELSHSKVK